MKVPIYTLLTILFSFLLISCNSADVVKERNFEFKMQMDSWLGAHISELLMPTHWGNPHSKVSDGKGGFIYSWRKSTSDIRIYQHWSGDWRAQDNSYTQYWEFYTNKDGVITSYRYGSE